MSPRLGGLRADRPRQAVSRAVVKTVCYRLLMVLVSVVVAYLVVGDVSAALSIGLVTNAVKTATYYGYERFWDRITWGIAES
jgi:uncharacterized membrane protein